MIFWLAVRSMGGSGQLVNWLLRFAAFSQSVNGGIDCSESFFFLMDRLVLFVG